MIKQTFNKDTQLVTVVSAMKGETARLRSLAEKNFIDADPRSLDLLLASGEQQACGPDVYGAK